MKRLKKLIRTFSQAPEFSEESFRQLHKDILYLHPVTASNKNKVIELLKSITEALVFADQHNKPFFDYFCKNNMQAILIRLLKNQLFKEVTLQIFQTANILVHNLSSSKRELIKLPLYEELILYPFDFDEETSEHYISLMKSIAVNLPEDLLLEFLTIRNFSLFSGTSMFCFAQDSMVRAASRIVILSILKMDSPQVRAFVQHSGFLMHLVNRVKDQLFYTNAKLEFPAFSQTVSSTIDVFYYISDIIIKGQEETSKDLNVLLIEHIISPILLDSISAERRTDSHISISLACFILANIIKVIRVPSSIDLIVSSLLVEPSTRAILLGILRCKDDNLIALVLLMISAILDSVSVSVSIIDRSGLGTNNFQKHEMVETLLKLISTNSSFKQITNDMIVYILNKIDLSESPSLLNQAIQVKLSNIEKKITPGNFDAIIDMFEDLWELVDIHKMPEVCPVSLVYPNSEGLSLPSHLKKPKGKHEKIRNEVYGFLMLLKFKYTLFDPEKLMYPINFLKVGAYKSKTHNNSDEQELEIPVAADLFQSLFGRITHLHNLKNIENSRHFFIANQNYSKISLIFDGPQSLELLNND